MIQTIQYRLTGVVPLLMHNGQLANPLNPHTKSMKEMSGIRKKTEDDLAELSRREWLGGLYTDSEGFPCLPADVLLATLIEGAKKSKLGKQFAPGCFIEADARLKIGDTRKAVDLWGDPEYVDFRGVKVTQSRVMRTRPRFPKWATDVEVHVNTTLVNLSQVDKAWEDAGVQVGVGDYRPRFGRFNVERK